MADIVWQVTVIHDRTNPEETCTRYFKHRDAALKMASAHMTNGFPPESITITWIAVNVDHE